MISGGENHVVALRADGTVWAWGTNAGGQLGDNNATAGAVYPKQVNYQDGSALTDFVAVAAGRTHSLALRSDGTVWYWGEIRNADGTLSFQLVPSQVDGLGHVKDISAGFYSSYALKDDGTVWAWGMNSLGQLGNGTTIDSNAPVQVLGVGGTGYLSGVKKVVVGDMFAAALKNDGTVVAWGANGSGQLGIPSTGVDHYESAPVVSTVVNNEIPGPIKDIGAGMYFTYVVTQSGQLWTFNWPSSPTRMLSETWSGKPDISDIVKISGGYAATVALRPDGTLWSAGLNAYGSLGANSIAHQNNQLQVAGPGGSGYLGNVRDIGRGWYNMFAVLNDGTAYSWGLNSYGQLGNGETGSGDIAKLSRMPVQVVKEDGTPFLLGSPDLRLDRIMINTDTFEAPDPVDDSTTVIYVSVPYGEPAATLYPYTKTSGVTMVWDNVSHANGDSITVDVMRGSRVAVPVRIRSADGVFYRDYSIELSERALDKSYLASMIENAQAVYNIAVAGEEPGQYPTSAKAALLDAINSAKNVYESADNALTQAAVNGARETLSYALNVFAESVNRPADKRSLAALLQMAQQLLVTAVEGTKPDQYAAGSKSVFQSTVNSAVDVMNASNASQATVDSALSALQSAINAFDISRILPPIIYREDFENADKGGFTASSSAEGGPVSWEWGTPTFGPASAQSGTNLWGTNLSGRYSSNENSYLISPPIDTRATNVKKLKLYLWKWEATESGYDYSRIEVSNDDGKSWAKIYEHTGGEYSQDESVGEGEGGLLAPPASGMKLPWTRFEYDLDPSYAVEKFRIRFNLQSDSSVVDAGFYVDNIKIGLFKKDINEVIAESKVLLNASKEGWYPGQYPYGSMAVLSEAISAAEKISSDSAATESQIDAATTALTNAMNQFKSLEIKSPNTLKGSSKGKIVTIGGVSWILLDPATGMSITYEDQVRDGGKQWSPDMGDIAFDPSKAGTLANYLNGTFYDSLNDSGFILSHDWDVKDETGAVLYGATGTVTAKVGLLSAAEYRKYSTYYGDKTIGTREGDVSWWLITPYSSEGTLLIDLVRGGSGELFFNHPPFRYGVRPVVYLNPDAYIAQGDGSLGNPFQLLSSPTDELAISEAQNNLTDLVIKGANASLSEVTSPMFLPKSYAYDVAIDWASSGTAIDAVSGEIHRPNDADAKVTITATIHRGAASVQKTFNVTVLKQSSTSDNANLSKVTYNSSDLPFLNGEYFLEVPYALTDVVLGLQKADALAKISSVTSSSTVTINTYSETSIYVSNLKLGDNLVYVTVMSQSGTSKTSVIRINRLAGSDTDVAEVRYNDRMLDRNGNNFMLSVDNQITEVTLQVITNNTNSTISVPATVTGVTYSGKIISFTDLPVGMKTVNMSVYAEDKIHVGEYTISVARKSYAEPSLTAETNEGTVTASGTEITIQAQAGVTSLRIYPSVSPGATIDTVTGATYSNGIITVVLTPGKTTTIQVPIKVNGSVVKTYTISVNSPESSGEIPLPENKPVPIPTSGSKVFTAPGGVTINLTGVSIPAGATITVKTVTPANLPASMKSAGATLEVTLSEGVTFGQPVRIEFTLNAAADSTKVGVFYYNPDKQRWEYQRTKIENGKAVAYVSHFSTYGVFEAEDTVIVPSITYKTDMTAEIGYNNLPDGTVIYYTLDGSEPTESSQQFDTTKKLSATAGETFRAYAISPGKKGSLQAPIPARTSISDVLKEIGNKQDQNGDNIFNEKDVASLLKKVMPFTVPVTVTN
nr:immunoglobulin-like domain-containing protein [Paenibacillus hamazuiensis]